MAEGFDKVRMIKVLNQAQLEKFVKDRELEKISEYMEQNAIQCMEGLHTVLAAQVATPQPEPEQLGALAQTGSISKVDGTASCCVTFVTQGTQWGAPPREENKSALTRTESLNSIDPKYHVFFGHRQMDGSAQIGELCNIFEHRLDLHCWRNISQTEQDVDAMIRGVAEPAVHLLYLTKNVLSYYVTIEARAAMTLKKLAIVLMEDDDRKPSYAGGSIEVATKGWPADLVDYLEPLRDTSRGVADLSSQLVC